MAKRSSFSKRKSGKDFKRKSGVHPKNAVSTLRGGYRL